MELTMRSCSISVMAALAGPARAEGLVLQAADFNALRGSAGSFLVTPPNTGMMDATLSAYLIQMTTDVPGLQFTGVARPMPPDPAYVFPGAAGPTSSDFTPPFTPPVVTFTATDFTADPNGSNILPAGQT
jgi:hypothetical protein